MAKANLQLIYVSDIKCSTNIYSRLLEKPIKVTPRYVAFESDEFGDSLFALWSGDAPDPLSKSNSEIGIMLDSDEEVDKSFAQFSSIEGLKVIQNPTTEVFGRTYLLKDRDGHLIRVCSRDY